MSTQQRHAEVFTLAAMHPTAARTATGNGTAVDMLAFDGDIVLVLDSAAGTGTSPTLDVTVQASATSGGTFTAIAGAVFTQVAGTASQQRIVVSKDDNQRWMRIVHTIGGSTPSFTFSVNALGQPKYQ